MSNLAKVTDDAIEKTPPSLTLVPLYSSECTNLRKVSTVSHNDFDAEIFASPIVSIEPVKGKDDDDAIF